MRGVRRFVQVCVKVLASVAALVLLALMIAVCVATISRYAFREPFAFLIDLSGYALVFVAFLSAPWLLSVRGHVQVDLLINRVRPKAQAYWNAIVHVWMALVALAITYPALLLTWEYLVKHRVMQDTLDTPQWILLLPIPLGSFFVVVQAVLNAVDDIRTWRARAAAGAAAGSDTSCEPPGASA